MDNFVFVFNDDIFYTQIKYIHVTNLLQSKSAENLEHYTHKIPFSTILGWIFSAGNSEICRVIKDRPDVIQSQCGVTFLAPDADGKKYEINLTVRKHVEGKPPLELVHSDSTIFPYPPPIIEKFLGSPQIGEIMPFDIYYPYTFGISIVAYLQKGDAPRKKYEGNESTLEKL